MFRDLMEQLIQTWNWGQRVNGIRCPADRVRPCDVTNPASGLFHIQHQPDANVAIGQHSTRSSGKIFDFYTNIHAAGKNRDLVGKISHISGFRELPAPENTVNRCYQKKISDRPSTTP